MLSHTVTAFTDAFTMAGAVQSQIKSFRFDTPASKKLRNLLFLFFGITFGDQNQINAEKAQDYIYVQGVFNNIDALLQSPSAAGLPWLHCLEDYSFFLEHLIGSDGRENLSAPLAAERWDMKLPDGNYYPGLMYAPALSQYYVPRLNSLYGGICTDTGSPPGSSMVNAFAWPSPGRTWGITLCPSFFSLLNIGSFGIPPANAPAFEVIKIFAKTASVVAMHEMAHLINRVANIPFLADIIDQPLVVPPDGNYRNRDWPLWTLDPVQKSYGFSKSLALGLAKPNLGLLNAENYAIFAMCWTYQNLDCVADMAYLIARGESVPFQPAPEAVTQIRQGRSNLLR